VVQEIWGAFGISFVGCNRATMAYSGPAAFGSGGLGNVVRIIGIDNADACAFPGGLRSVQGQLQAAPYSLGDGDTNDPGNPERPNNTPAQVQPAPNPVAVAGFVATAAVGGGGRFGNRNDVFDAYRMTLTAGQSLQLIVSDWQAGNPGAKDLDLWVYSAGNSNQPIHTSETISRNEFWQVPQSGTYDVIVVAYNGASNYTLAASFAPVPQGAQALSSLGDFEPGEIIVRFNEEIIPKAGESLERAQAANADRLGLQLKQAAIDGPQLWTLADNGIAKSMLGEMPAFTALAETLADHGYEIGRAGEQRRHELVATIKALQSRTDIRYAEPNGRVYSMAVPNDPRYPEQWHYRQINLPQAWDIGVGTPSVLVGVADTGAIAHPDLAGNVRFDLGYDFLPALRGVDGDGPDSDARDPGDDRFGPGRGTFHGTHVAGTIAALSNNAVGVAGVAAGARVVPIRVLGLNGGLDHEIAGGMRWAANSAPLGVAPPGRALDVLNLSLGGYGPCPAIYTEAVALLRQRGTIVVTAAGNNNSGDQFRPASCAGVVNVSAVNNQEQHANYSNCGNAVSLAAPGGEMGPSQPQEFPLACKPPTGRPGSTAGGVLSTVATGGGLLGYPVTPLLGHQAGTSMAAPHVAGVAALMKSANPSLTPDQFDALLASGQLTRDIGTPGRDNLFGHGLIDARKAVEAARNLAGGAPPPVALIPEPASLDFGEINDRLTVTLRRSGNGPLSFIGATAQGSWLVSMNPAQVDAQGFGTYEVLIDRQGLPPGEYQGAISFNTMPAAPQPVQANVRMRVGQPQQQGEAGLLYLLVIDAFTGNLIDLYAGTGNAGSYTFQVPGMVSGDYILVATSDNDYDQTICDAGEFCGAYPNEPGAFTLGGSNLSLGIIPVFPDQAGLGQLNATGASVSQLGSRTVFARGVDQIQLPDTVLELLGPGPSPGAMRSVEAKRLR
jgi:serine protease